VLKICSILSGKAGGRPNGGHGRAGRAAVAAAGCVRVDALYCYKRWPAVGVFDTRVTRAVDSREQ